MNSASARASSVLPTPVGPMKRKLPIGRSGSCRPARERRSALDTASTAASWPITRSCRRSSMCTSLAISDSIRRDSGMPVQRATTSATSSSSTSSLRKVRSDCSSRRRASCSVTSCLQLRDLAVAQLRGTLEVGLALGALGVAVGLLQALLGRADGVDGLLLALPVSLHLVRLLAQVGQLALDRLAARDAGVVGVLGQRLQLDLQLLDAPLQRVDLLGHRVDLDAQARRGLVDQVDRLVGQEAVGDVAVGERGRGDDRRVLDAHAVVHLVALLEAAQDRDGGLHRRLAHLHGLEAALQRGVLLDVLAVLVERGGAHAAQLAAGEHGLEQVGRVHGALGRARADDRVQLVEEQDHLALRLGDLGEDGLEPVLELAPVLGARDQRADVERDHAAVAQRVGDVAGHHPLGEALDDRGLAHAGLADQHGVVLRAPREHLDHAPDLVVAADHRVELALLGRLREVEAEALQRLVAVLGVLVGHAVRPAHALRPPPRAGRARRPRRSAGRPTARAAGARWTRTRRPCRAPRRRRGAAGPRGRSRSAGSAWASPVTVGSASSACVGAPAHRLGVGVRAAQDGHHDAAVLLEQGEQQVVGGHLRVAARGGQPLSGCEGLLALDCEAIWLHEI